MDDRSGEVTIVDIQSTCSVPPTQNILKIKIFQVENIHPIHPKHTLFLNLLNTYINTESDL